MQDRNEEPSGKEPVRRMPPKPPGDPTPPMLINQLARLFACRMREVDLPGVMTQDSARQIMRELTFHNGCSQKELVGSTHLKAPTVSVTLKRMEDEGLVRREEDENDMRTVHVYLTEAGIRHTTAVRRKLGEVDDEMMKGFSEEEQTQLLSLLIRMRSNILPEEPKNHSGINRNEN